MCKGHDSDKICSSPHRTCIPHTSHEQQIALSQALSTDRSSIRPHPTTTFLHFPQHVLKKLEHTF